MTVTRDVAGSLTAVLDLGGAARQAPATLELRGPLEPSLIDAALAALAAHRPQLRGMRPRILRHGPSRHVLHLAAPYPAGALADLLTAAAPGHRADRALPQPLALTPVQHDLLAGQVHPGRQAGQLMWRWHGPLDTARFTAAWQCVFRQEVLLRAAFVWDPRPRLALHADARPEVVRHAHGTYTRRALVEHERSRGFDLSRPGLLRLALLDGVPQVSGVEPSYTDVVLTYHHGLLDGWSAGLLAREFYRSYLAGGRARGGERRPDLRDYRRWLDMQDPAQAQDFRSVTGAPAGAGLPGAARGTGTGSVRHRIRLHAAEAARLAHWAAQWGVTESSVLQAVWAMLLFRAGAGHSGSDTQARGPGLEDREPASVGFRVGVSGRAVSMNGIAYLPGPFDAALPMTLRVDPRGTVPALLRAARDRALDMAAYEWLSAGQAGPAGEDGAGTGLLDTHVCFEHRPSHLQDLRPQLAAHGLRVTDIEPAGRRDGYAISIAARRDEGAGLVLTSVHDRGRVRDDHAAGLLADSARLLRELTRRAGESTTVAEALSGLASHAVPRLQGPIDEADCADPVDRHLVRLRGAARPGAGTVCLIAPPGEPGTRHAALARRYRGPEALTVLRADPARVPESLDALRSVLSGGGPLVLGGFAGAGALACELAGFLAQDPGGAPLVVLGAAGDANDRGDSAVRELAHAMSAAARRARPS
ncbi:condensation domain-containing protein [Streptomyces albidoflavus]